MERILVAVDFSDCSRRALGAALELSRLFQAPLHVVHVLPSKMIPAQAGLAVRMVDSLRLDHDLNDFVLEHFKGSAADFDRIDRRLLHGEAAEQILAEAASWPASLIVVGSHGRSAFGRLFLGSVSTQIAGKATVPVLVVPSTGFEKPSRILAAIDVDSSIEVVLQTGQLWQELFDSKLMVAHVFDDVPEPIYFRLSLESQVRRELEVEHDNCRGYVASVVERIFTPSSTPSVIYLNGRPDVQLCREAADGEYGLLIVGSHEPRDRFDVHNTSTSVVHRSPCPVLIVPSLALPHQAAGE